MQYQRDDIYFCEGCGQFFHDDTDEIVDVPLWEIPADFALAVMYARKQRFQFCHIQKCLRAGRVKNKKRKKSGN